MAGGATRKDQKTTNRFGVNSDLERKQSGPCALPFPTIFRGAVTLYFPHFSTLGSCSEVAAFAAFVASRLKNCLFPTTQLL